MNTFLPENEKAPEGNYMKLLEGENTFRVLSSAITGYEYWNNQNKPVRLKIQPASLPQDIRVEEDKKPSIRYFWAFIIWNYRAEKRQILEITQASIQTAIRNLIKNKQWGDPHDYDITITKSGSGFDTEYSVMPCPKSPAPAANADGIHLEALFTGDDPFMPRMKEKGNEGYISPDEIKDIF